MPHPRVKIRRKHLFEDLIASLKAAVVAFPDPRTGENLQYSLLDVGLGAFSVFYMQHQSFLSHQEMMEKRLGISNARTLFGVENIPTPNHIRQLLDEVTPEMLTPVFTDCFAAVKNSGYLESFRVKLGVDNDQLLIALDGTQYFCSGKIQCVNCSTKNHDGKARFCHQMINPAIVAPGSDKVICLEPEFITPQDGDGKQDCESKAGKRWLEARGKGYAKLKVTILADDLYSHQPFCQKILDHGLNFILVCKEDSHRTLYEYLKVQDDCGDVQELTQSKWNGKRREVWQYRYANSLPIKDGEYALEVNWCQLTITRQDTGQQLFKNAFITNHEITEKTVETIILAGRARWKTENENNNTLKTKGYNLKHNYGHGDKHLSSLLATMNILAYLFHTLQELMSKSYRKLRDALPTRKIFFDHLKVVLGLFVFKEWEVLMRWILKGLEEGYPAEKFLPGMMITRVD